MPYDEQEYFTVEKRDPSRLSSCMNDDDYDYAIELRMDDEYRQAADALPNIAEVADVDDDELLVLLDERRQEVVTESSTKGLQQRRGIVKFIRESLSMHSMRRDSTYSFNSYQAGNGNRVLSVIPSPIRLSDQNDIEEGEIDSSHDSTNRNDARKDSPSARACLPKTTAELESGSSLEVESSSHSKSNTTSKSAAGWSTRISSLLGWSSNSNSASADTVVGSDKAAAVGRHLEPESERSNPVKALFEPISLLSGKFNSSSSTSTRGKESKSSGSIEITDSGKRRAGKGQSRWPYCVLFHAPILPFNTPYSSSCPVLLLSLPSSPLLFTPLPSPPLLLLPLSQMQVWEGTGPSPPVSSWGGNPPVPKYGLDW